MCLPVKDRDGYNRLICTGNFQNHAKVNVGGKLTFFNNSCKGVRSIFLGYGCVQGAIVVILLIYAFSFCHDASSRR